MAMVGKRGIFGSRQERFFRGTMHSLAPRDWGTGYDLQDPSNPLAKDPSSMFKSETVRFDHEDMPPKLQHTISKAKGSMPVGQGHSSSLATDADPPDANHKTKR